jgi:SAM-dependent methyltransferase
LSTIADSSAFKDTDRVLPQHQAALTLLQARLSVPGIQRVLWLDLACGKGQIITSLEENLSSEARGRIEYWGYDLNQGYARETEKAAERLGFASFQIKVGDLLDFDQLLSREALFDFITLTNTVHEIQPVRLANLLYKSIMRLSEAGTLFVYDMEKIQPLELGAVPWSRDDVKSLIRHLLDALGATAYHPEVSRWSHKTCKGWNVQLERQHLGISLDDAVGKGDVAIRETCDEVTRIIKQRSMDCRAALENLTKYGAETAEEQEDKLRLLFEFWALSRWGGQ